MDMYCEIILDHYKHPRNFGHLDNPDAKVEEGNVTCGDRIVMEIKSTINDLPAGEAGLVSRILTDIRFSGEGCAISQASASMLTEKVVGLPVGEIMNMQAHDIVRMLGTTLTPSRTKCAILSLEVLQKAIGLL